MKPFVDSQELANDFNEDEAIWRRYEKKRGRRRFLVLPIRLPEEVLDALDWLAAERECRTTRCVGKQPV